MKPRLTNKYLDLVSEVERELMKPFSIDSEVIFLVFPSLGYGHFSIQLVETQSPFLITRRWNQDLGESHQLGIYNLDNVRVDEDRVEISGGDLLTLGNIKTVDKGVKELNGIVLDGVDFKLIVRGQEIHWRTSEQISIELTGLLNKMVSMAGLQQQL